MLETYCRASFQKILVDPVAEGLNHKLSANVITACSLVTGLLVLPALCLKYNLLACGLLLLSGYLDTLDGTLARFSGQSSKLGGFFDIVSDRLVEWFVVMGLYYADPARAPYIIWLLGSIMMCVTLFLVIGIMVKENSEKSFYYSPGLIERAEAFIFFIAMILCPKAFAPLCVTLSLLIMLTCVLHARHFYAWVQQVGEPHHQ